MHDQVVMMMLMMVIDIVLHVSTDDDHDDEAVRWPIFATFMTDLCNLHLLDRVRESEADRESEAKLSRASQDRLHNIGVDGWWLVYGLLIDSCLAQVSSSREWTAMGDAFANFLHIYT